jgi:hypothetical protein
LQGLVGGRRSGSEKRQTWCRPPERSSAPDERDGNSRRGKRARQGVSVTAPWRLARGRTNLRGSCFERGVRGTRRGSRGGRGPPVRRHQPRHRSGSEMPLAAIRRHRGRLDRSACARARVGGWGGEAVAEQARAQRPRVGGSSGCSLTTSRLQRLATGAFPSEACDASAERARPGVASSGDSSP